LNGRLRCHKEEGEFFVPLTNCPRCGALFNKIAVECCNKCYAEEEKLLRKTQDYLRKNRNAPKYEVMAEVGLTQWMVEKWIGEKRICIYDPTETPAAPRCNSCGRETKPGEPLCKTCQFKRLSASNTKKSPEPAKESDGMKSGSSRGMHYKPRKQASN
jgi:hypothetical protein